MHDAQPEPKPYPTHDDYGFCPFRSLFLSDPAGGWSQKLMPCDPFNCHLSINDHSECCFRDAARTFNAMQPLHQTAQGELTLIRHTLQELSIQLAHVLQKLEARKSD